MKLAYTIEEISANRVNEAREILKNISNNDNLFIQQFSLAGKTILAATNTSRKEVSDFMEWRFSTSNPEILASYYEIWQKLNSTQYYLTKIYIHLYSTNDEYRKRIGDGEYVLLHCDPNEDESAEHSNYKRSPHLHIKSAYNPLPHSHWALNLNEIDLVLSSRDELNRAFFSATKLLREQVLDLL